MPPVDLTVIVKVAGERTVDAALSLLYDQVPADRIVVVEETQSEVAIRRTYEIGIERAATWTMTLGADALVRAGAVGEFVAAAARQPSGVFQIEGRVFDKFTGVYRQAGQRIYRTSLLPLALPHLPAPGSSLRSEFSVLQAMTRLGYLVRPVPLVMGLHDFEQRYRDVYRTAVVHAIKHRPLLASMVERCLQQWRDADFRVALRGLYDGLVLAAGGPVDPRRIDGLVDGTCLGDLGLTEKPPLDVPAFRASFDQAYASILAANVPPRLDAFDAPGTRAWRRAWERYRGRVVDDGLVTATVASVGGWLARIGARLERSGGGARS